MSGMISRDSSVSAAGRSFIFYLDIGDTAAGIPGNHPVSLPHIPDLSGFRSCYIQDAYYFKGIGGDIFHIGISGIAYPHLYQRADFIRYLPICLSLNPGGRIRDYRKRQDGKNIGPGEIAVGSVMDFHIRVGSGRRPLNLLSSAYGPGNAGSFRNIQLHLTFNSKRISRLCPDIRIIGIADPNTQVSTYFIRNIPGKS